MAISWRNCIPLFGSSKLDFCGNFIRCRATSNQRQSVGIRNQLGMDLPLAIRIRLLTSWLGSVKGLIFPLLTVNLASFGFIVFFFMKQIIE